MDPICSFEYVPEFRESMNCKDRRGPLGIIVVGFLVDKVVGPASAQLFGPVVERFGLRGIH